jgi:hypothetical protein
MSKYEILISGKIKQEVTVLDKYADEATFHNLKLNNHLFWIFNIPKIFVTLIRISVFVVIGYGYLN